MDYRTMIENRKSVRVFAEHKVNSEIVNEITTYYKEAVQRLIPELKTELLIFGNDAKAVLEGAAGYNNFLGGRPQYLVLLSEKGDLAGENAGYMMEDLILKLTAMDLGTCWLTFTDSAQIKKALGIDSDLEVAAIAAFGYPVKSTKRLRLNLLSMTNVDNSAKRHYFDPKKSIRDLVFLNSWGNNETVDGYIGFYDDMLWEAFYAAALSPSYLNRQPYGFVIHDGNIILVRTPDLYTTEIDGSLGLGIALLHFTAVAENWAGKVEWKFGGDAADLQLPAGYEVIASCRL